MRGPVLNLVFLRILSMFVMGLEWGRFGGGLIFILLL